MRQITTQDITCLAGALSVLPEGDRETAAYRIMERAQYADQYRLRHGRIHAAFGDGTVQGAIGYLPRVEQRLPDNLDFLRSMALVCNMVADRIEQHAARRAA